MLLNIVFIAVPIILIVMIIIDLLKAVFGKDEKEQNSNFNLSVKRVLNAIILFFVPTIVSVVMELLTDVGGQDYTACYENATAVTIEKLEATSFDNRDLLVASDYSMVYFFAEKEEQCPKYFTYEENIKGDRSGCYTSLNKKDDSYSYNATDKQYCVKNWQYDDGICSMKKGSSSGYPIGTTSGGASPDKIIPAEKGISTSGYCVALQETEPDPGNVLDCYSIDHSYYYFAKTNNGQSLGLWPKNYESIPTQVTVDNSCGSPSIVLPISKESYNFGYNHQSIDISSPFGTPVYSPADGKIEYSTWGHTGNRYGGESAYSVSIVLNEPINITLNDGSPFTITKVFLTHLSGLIYKCSSCNISVKKGELIAYSGTAHNNKNIHNLNPSIPFEVGYAPHLHMSLTGRDKNNQLTSLYTPVTEELFGLVEGTGFSAGQNCVRNNTKVTRENSDQEEKNNNNNNNNQVNTGNSLNIIIGDSRAVGLQYTVNPPSNYLFIAESSMGYNWLKTTATSKLDETLKNNPGKHNIIVNLGINDLGNVQNYVNYFNEMKTKYSNHRLIIVSVNPVVEENIKPPLTKISNSSVEGFNNTIRKGLKNIKYCDTYTKLKGNVVSGDGIHYEAVTNSKIFEYINACL